LKKWADKDILLCPVCHKSYEYCHGRIVPPYFRHKEKQECDYLYSEPETKEHINGKKILYEWIKNQDGVNDVILEGWIPETKQRPDIMFNYNGEQYVIEYQCSPIASEYFERHELYQAGGIKDIWILGTEKYLGKTHREKSIQDHTVYYLDVENNELLLSYLGKGCHKALLKYLPYNKFNCKSLFQLKLESMCFTNGEISIKEDIVLSFIKKYEEWYADRVEAKAKLKNVFNEVLENVKQYCPQASISSFHNNSIELGRFNLFISIGQDNNICIIEVKKRNFRKVKYYKSNKSRWECYFKTADIKHFNHSEITSDDVINFALQSINNYKAVK
jgi:competence protein CoiA